MVVEFDTETTVGKLAEAQQHLQRAKAALEQASFLAQARHHKGGAEHCGSLAVQAGMLLTEVETVRPFARAPYDLASAAG